MLCWLTSSLPFSDMDFLLLVAGVQWCWCWDSGWLCHGIDKQNKERFTAPLVVSYVFWLNTPVKFLFDYNSSKVNKSQDHYHRGLNASLSQDTPLTP